ncbi:iron-sulfur cluster repair di-iron protein [Bacillus sp. FJAT-27264]|uniref:iron-sulfur cluster repair di-iron protein n=1 Tax=Paenibacillus sp. (strain DSM 101736 / FJAT-27264) TaxID=1850362 RepID=UPI000807D566|nr:iron-sulfur cluster repair di-iron protein [Bacillus sp. FJAT-27264]OBZ19596.1 iron-sulfur cluster repair di-iron protein [Bacillus sp. FJAT-27264]
MDRDSASRPTPEISLSTEAWVRDIVLQFPKSADYFKANRIDFCCGGARPLGEAATERGLDKDAVLADLNKLLKEHPILEEETVWNHASSSDLIAHIVNKHHQYLRQELPLIAQNVTKVFRVHGGDSPHLAQLHALFHKLMDELLDHTAKEEDTQFPRILAYSADSGEASLVKLRAALGELESEHDAAGDILRQIRRITEDFTPPEHACTTYRLTYARLEELEGMTFEHIHLENNILFPRYQ